MNSVERLVEYAGFAPEAPPVVPGRRPPPAWPHAGAIQVKDLVLRYSPTSDPVLRGLSFSVAPRQKVRGVLGPSGVKLGIFCSPLARALHVAARACGVQYR